MSLVQLKSYSLRNTDSDFCDVVCISENGSDNSRDHDIYLMEYCLSITYHQVLSVRSTQTKPSHYSTNRLISLCFQHALQFKRLALSSILSFQHCDFVDLVSSCIMIHLHLKGWAVPNPDRPAVHWLRKSSEEKADSNLSPLPKRGHRTQILSSLNPRCHLPFFLVKVCTPSPSLQKKLSNQGQFQLNITTCMQKKSLTRSQQPWLHQLRAVVQVKIENTLHLQALRSLRGFCPSPA